MASSTPLRIGFVPEHFSTPLYFAQKYFSLSATLVPFPSGTGHMIQALGAHEIDIGIGLTEGWIAGLGKQSEKAEEATYKLVGTYVETPLCWAISTGANRTELTSVSQLAGSKMGVSRLGSGSHIMGSVLADTHGWLPSPSSSSSSSSTTGAAATSGAPPTPTPLQTFASLRQAVTDRTADFFMWEHFTTKRYYDNGELKRLGEIYTPWPSWLIVASTATFPSLNSPNSSNDNKDKDQQALTHLFTALDSGISHFLSHPDEAVAYISTALDYSAEDARAWLKTVRFATPTTTTTTTTTPGTQGGTQGVDVAVVEKTVGVLKKAGVLGDTVGAEQVQGMVGVGR